MTGRGIISVQQQLVSWVQALPLRILCEPWAGGRPAEAVRQEGAVESSPLSGPGQGPVGQGFQGRLPFPCAVAMPPPDVEEALLWKCSDLIAEPGKQASRCSYFTEVIPREAGKDAEQNKLD